jgi:hypothetical protein
MKVRIAGGFMSSGTGKVSDRIPTYGRGRVCEAPGCGTLLSSYNPALRCSLHAAVVAPQPHPWLADRPLTSLPK